MDGKIHFGLTITHANWSNVDRKWTIRGMEERTGRAREFNCDFLITATGYYDYDQGHVPDFPGVEGFKGQCVHPQHWPEGLNHKGKRVFVIGSGATAVTLIPAMASDTAHITMLQRSPSYMYSVPGIDRMAAVLKRFLPERWVYRFARERNIRIQRAIYKLSRRFPKLMRRLLLGAVRRQLGPDFDMSHFTPRYMPWDERLCAVPDSDLFKALREGRASVVTDHIDRFTEQGILLKSGRTLEADIIVTATGLRLQTLGGMALSIDGRPTALSDHMTYKSVLIEGVPNLAYLFGYANISWTLKIDLAAEYVCRVLNEMDRRGVAVVTPRAPEGEIRSEHVLGSLQAGYVQRDGAVLPRQGRNVPWRVLHYLERDRSMLRQRVDDPALEWSTAA